MALILLVAGLLQQTSSPLNSGVPIRPNDPYFIRQVSFASQGHNASFDVSTRRPSRRTFTCDPRIDLNVAGAWAVTTGSKHVVVALLDDGYFYRHEDVRQNIWQNPGETGVDGNGYRRESNGVDDDDNGYVDDVVGWDFAFDDPDPDGYIFDGKLNTRIQPYTHSITAMGIIGARGNNGVGVAGINWNVSMMLLKMCPQGTWPPGVFDRCVRAAKAIRYAVDNGARVINWSGFVSQKEPDALRKIEDAIEYARGKGVLLVVAAGNNGKNIDLPANRMYPQCFDHDNIINVAEIDLTGKLDVNSGPDHVSSSNYGRRTVDIAAIGRNYTSQVYQGRGTYGLGGGTSDAAPVVTGVAALVLSVRPDFDHKQLKSLLLETSHKLDSLEGKVACGGMIDAAAAIKAAQGQR